MKLIFPAVLLLQSGCLKACGKMPTALHCTRSEFQKTDLVTWHVPKSHVNKTIDRYWSMIFPYFPQNTKHVKCFLVIFVSLFHEAWCQAPNGALLFHPNPSGWLDPWRPRNHSDSYIYYRMILIINRMSKNLVYLKKLFSKWSMYATNFDMEYIWVYIYTYISI